MTDMGTKIIQEGQIKEFQAYLMREERAATTIAKYSHDLRLFVNFLGGSEVSKEQVIKFKDWLIQNYHIGSVNSMVAAVNSFLDYAGWPECRVKLIKVQRQLFCEEEKELHKNEYYRLVKTAQDQGNERLAIMMQTLCGLGLRVSELRFVTVRAVKEGKLQIFNKGKNRNVVVSGKLRELLLLYIEAQEIKKGEVFVTKTGRPLDRSNIWREMKRLYEEAQVTEQKVFPHNLRHLFARTYYEMKNDVVRLADIMGHSSIETTRIYTTSSGQEYRQQLESLELVL